MKINYILIITSTVLLYLQTFSLAQDQGNYFFRNFTARELKSSDWIQSIVQDNRGIIYAGNNTGTILEYDGTNWRPIQATIGPIRELQADSSGKIYVGSYADFGFLEPGPDGKMRYLTLMDQVKNEDKNISDVWSIDIFGKDVYFRSVERLFRLRNGRITAFRNPYGWFGNLIILDDQLYVTIDNKGIILRMDGDSLVRFFESKEFSNVVFGTSANFTAHKKLVGSWGGGVYIFCPGNSGMPGKKVLERFASSPASLNQNLSRAVEVYEIESGIFAARTDNGITVFNGKGSELLYISTNNGLNSNLVETIYSDKDHLLWIGTEKGITRMDISSPLTSWYSSTETSGAMWGLNTYNGILYFSNFRGIFYLSNNNSSEIIHDETFGPVLFKDPLDPRRTCLLAANGTSLLEIRNNKPYHLLSFPKLLLYQQIFISKFNPDRIYLFCTNGLYGIRFKDGKWFWEGNIEGITTSIQSLSEDQNGDLWMVIDNYKRLMHLRLRSEQNSRNKDKITFSKTIYEPPEFLTFKWIKCFTYRNHILYGTDKGLFKFEVNSGKLLPDSMLGSRFSDGTHAVNIFREGPNGVVFIAGQIHQSDDIGMCVPQADGSYKWYTKGFAGLTPQMRIYDACFDGNGSLWIACDEGLIKYNPEKDRRIPVKFNTLIREVTTGKDSVLFYGTYFIELTGGDISSTVRIPTLLQPEYMKPVLSYRYNSVKFDYSSASFEREDQHVYQYLLEGLDKEWSNWTASTSKEYSHLPEGKYTFRVKGKNIFGMEGEEASYHFTILPPWYRTLWSYTGYALAATLFIYLIVLYNTRRLKVKNLMLEELVEERTTEVFRQKEEIQKQRDALEETNAIKDKLFTIIGHDLRNSLSALISISNSLSRHFDDMSGDDTIEGMKKIEHAAHEMEKLLEHLLDWTKLQNGKVQLNPESFNLGLLAQEMISIMRTAAEKKNITINLLIPAGTLITADRNMIGTILRNLLSNAIKFSPVGGVVDIKGRQYSRINGHFMYEVMIEDGGIGMNPEQLKNLFNIGRSSISPGTANEKGNGLGLHICKDLIELNGGSIHATSDPGKGSKFVFTIPYITLQYGENSDFNST
jgi:signal transduction histidine kinase